MLGKPSRGWSEITVNSKVLGTASYLSWLPGDILEACIRYLKCAKKDIEKWGTAYGGYGLNIEFDAETYQFGLVEIGSQIYSYDDRKKEEPYINLGNALCNHRENVDFVKKMTEEVISDIENDFEGWKWWDAMDEEEAENNGKDLILLLQEAKNCLL